MRPSREKREPQIGPLVTYNLTLLKLLVAHGDPNQPHSSTATSHLARFKLWSASLGAHRSSGTRALDYRLRDASSIRNQVLSLLRDLSTAIDEARAPVEEPSEMLQEHVRDTIEEYFRDDDILSQTPLDRSLAQIGYILDCLLRLSTTISNPAPHDHFESRVGSSEYYEPWDVRHVQDKFTDIDPVIATRLGKAITMRRHYFNYRQEHHARLAEGVGDDDNTGGDRTTIASSIPEIFKDVHSLDQIPLDSQSELSTTSYAPSSTEAGRLRVPGIPKEHLEGPFLCPFCQTIIKIETRTEWKQHVFRDLRPYICLEKSCKIPNQQYSRRSHWIAHMTQEHWRQWYCPFGCSELFPTRDIWRKHNSTHGQEALTENLNILEESSTCKALQKAVGSCPICLDTYIKDARSYSSHVGQHLEQLALFSLPEIEEVDEAANDESDEDDDDDENGSRKDGESMSPSGFRVLSREPHSSQLLERVEDQEEETKKGEGEESASRRTTQYSTSRVPASVRVYPPESPSRPVKPPPKREKSSPKPQAVKNRRSFERLHTSGSFKNATTARPKRSFDDLQLFRDGRTFE